MPTYGYRCQSCGDDFDVWQRMSDQAGASCPACGGPGRRLFFPVGIVFKGSGFYKTDSRNGSAAGAAAATTSKPAEGGETGSATATAPAKPEVSKPAPAKPAAPGPASAAAPGTTA